MCVYIYIYININIYTLRLGSQFQLDKGGNTNTVLGSPTLPVGRT